MMDFLRRLATARATDAARAVAVLPSRFAGENPLRATIGQARLAHRLDDGETSLSLDAIPAGHAAQRDPVAGVQPAQAAPRTLASHGNGEATSSTHAATEAPAIDAADSRVFPHRHGANPERAEPANLEPRGRAAPLAAGRGFQVAAAPAQPRVAPPLSEALLAQRTLQSRDESPVVHVTIGRIDVVANTAPAPAVRRSPAPRRSTVTLAEYLRGGSGSRR